jgi:hypothetical protein
MDTIENIFNINWATVVIGLFVVLFTIKKILNIIEYFKSKFRIKTGVEEDKNKVEERLLTLERHDKWQYEQINKICSGIENIQKRQTEKENRDNEIFKAQIGAELYHLHSKFMEQGYVSRVDLELFQTLSDEYLSINGNHLIKSKIIPEVINLPIKD